MTSTVCWAQQTATVAVFGPPGAGVRTLVESASDIDRLPAAGDASARRLPFQLGRLDVGEELTVRLLALSSDRAHRSLWPELTADAIGMAVVVDGHDIGAGFAALDQVERAGVRYGVVLNRFDDRLDYSPADIRAAMDLADRVVLFEADGRDRVQAQIALVGVLDGLFAWT